MVDLNRKEEFYILSDKIIDYNQSLWHHIKFEDETDFVRVVRELNGANQKHIKRYDRLSKKVKDSWKDVKEQLDNLDDLKKVRPEIFDEKITT